MEKIYINEYKGVEYVVKYLEYDNFPKGLLSNINRWWYCGYVNIDEDYKKYDYCEDYNIKEIKELHHIVHGEITYWDFGNWEEGENKFYLGFDTNHIFDRGYTRSYEFIEEHCKEIIDFLIENNYKLNKKQGE